jgi:diadenosine tetraphosphate (Ap4A) HIT family hydrolase
MGDHAGDVDPDQAGSSVGVCAGVGDGGAKRGVDSGLYPAQPLSSPAWLGVCWRECHKERLPWHATSMSSPTTCVSWLPERARVEVTANGASRRHGDAHRHAAVVHEQAAVLHDTAAVLQTEHAEHAQPPTIASTVTGALVSRRSVAGCPFCEIIAGDSPYRVVRRESDVVVLTDIAPINEGHLLVVPSLHVSTLGAIESRLAGRMFVVAQCCAAALRASVIRCEGVNVFMNDGAAASQTIDHVHLHVVPRYVGDSFRAPEVARVQAEPARLRIIAERVSTAWKQIPP